jgi:hypothetical protein
MLWESEIKSYTHDHWKLLQGLSARDNRAFQVIGIYRIPVRPHGDDACGKMLAI